MFTVIKNFAIYGFKDIIYSGRMAGAESWVPSAGGALGAEGSPQQ